MAQKKAKHLAVMQRERELKVDCYSGYRHPERPCSFTWQGKTFKIVQVEQEWLEPDSRFFRVRADDEYIYELCYNETEDKWWLTAPGIKERP